ncbi:MAG: hypothetical protein COZ46_07560 [Verrucomicrobia bacterium CG_4_10_14_3_um_filter_43_23]|nr:MAG: hypothetical protein AUJ82_03205 [Verrucomicrobia bacterium CG1_02_43_26]PIP59703.1 MAG: hypothetical protein COX01_02035 [Verrucomicrobia bacterium CG22_combo_CG10-13_8_21_14_all_43_17]PIX57715.1 MAG: hypothetical protein COZ46_07560 [Verrucomicrobia bacterium CG_4_10_14_3_um_filter_43_23]PIY62507.1 MAG: hypothetical protein COY94_01745 [Verrucomicrobia bacterium CG_4_10_14_0_8_um_filter_43_34]PJA44673.1 MAG: hypothetical protein CO175_01880 [Verrucomicrobia bacterium CG_4_9_14_3_um_fi
MPIYLYQIVHDDGSLGDIIEIEHHMDRGPLTKDPWTGQCIRKVYTAPNIASKHTPGKTRTLLDNKNIENAGFTKYERDKLTGKYNRIVGDSGPKTLDPNQ